MRALANILVLIIFFSSCKKEELQPVIEGTPEFFISGTIGARDVNIVAGDEDYYMYSSYKSSNSSVGQYIGELKTEGCAANCPESFVLIYTAEQPNVEEIASEAVLKTGFKSFTNEHAGNEVEVSFNPEESYTSKAVEVDYNWDFGDGTTSTEKNPKHIYTGDKEYYDVKLKVKTSKGCESEIKNRVYTNSSVNTDFRITQSNQSLALKPEVEDVAPQNYLWEFEDGFTASTPYVDYQSNPEKGIEKICLTITDSEGNRSQRCKNLVLKEEYAFCAANYVFNSGSRIDPNGELQLGTVYIKYTDPSGVEYYSQPNSTNGNAFEVTAVHEYDANENGLPTKKIDFSTNTTLESIDGKTISIENLTGSFAVAYSGK